MTALVPLPGSLLLLLEGAREGDARALGKLCTIIEARGAEARALLTYLDPATGRAHRIGFTGPPGSGKSSLLQHALTHFRARTNERTALVAVDPSSPRTGGAILGDRIRWSTHQTADNLFLRSMASRGSLGGLALGTRDMVSFLDACGFTRVLVESVGVGQLGTAISETVDCLVVVLNPESGDAVQMLKAGMLELADLYVINKADRPGAFALRDHLEGALQIAAAAGRDAPNLAPEILLTSSADGTGLDALWAAIEAWLAAAAVDGSLALRRSRQRRQQVGALLEESMQQAIADYLTRLESGKMAWEALDTRETAPYALAERLLADFRQADESTSRLAKDL